MPRWAPLPTGSSSQPITVSVLNDWPSQYRSSWAVAPAFLGRPRRAA